MCSEFGCEPELDLFVSAVGVLVPTGVQIPSFQLVPEFERLEDSVLEVVALVSLSRLSSAKSSSLFLTSFFMASN